MNTIKPKAAAIRATQPQTDLLKAAYAVSSTPLPQTIRELSEQTGLPEKWIANWFGRQRSKFKKTLDKAADTVAALKTEHPEVQLESDPPSSSPRTAAQDLPEPARKPIHHKAPRIRKPKAQNQKPAVKAEPKESPVPSVSSATVPLGQPPALLPSVTSSLTRDQNQNVSLQTCLSVNGPAVPAIIPQSMPNSVQSKNTSGREPLVKSAAVYASTGYYSVTEPDCRQMNSANKPRGHIMRTDFRHSFVDDYSLDSDAVSPPQQSLDSEFERPSSPTSNEAGNPITIAHSGAITASTSLNEPVTPAVEQVQRNHPTQQALTTLFNEDPAAYRAMLLPYAILFPTLFPALTGAMAAAPSQDPDNQTPAHFSAHSPSEEYTSIGFTSTDSPRLPAYTPYNEVLPPSSPPATDNESPITSWDFDSDHLDFSGLSYQDAPLYHLQERLEPFRLPESEYLFGREGVVNYLLDERLAEEEPFHAAMGPECRMLSINIGK